MFFPIVASFFWRGATNIGAILTIIGEPFFTIVSEFFVTFTVSTIYVGFRASLILMVVVSLFTKHSRTENVELFTRVTGNGPRLLEKVK